MVEMLWFVNFDEIGEERLLCCWGVVCFGVYIEMVSLVLRGILDRYDDGVGRGLFGIDLWRYVIMLGLGDGISMEEVVDRIVIRFGSVGGFELGFDGEGFDD